jgi:hypothetical protein
MRMMMKVKMDTEAGSRAIEDGSLPKALEETKKRTGRRRRAQDSQDVGKHRGSSSLLVMN